MGKVISLEEKLAEQQRFAETILNDDLTKKLIGANALRSDPSTYGKPVGADDYYNTVMMSEPMNKARNGIYTEKSQRAKQLGIAESPTVSNYDVLERKVGQYEEAVRLLPLGLLEEIAKKLAKGLQFDLPEKLKGLTAYALMQKSQAGEELDDEEKDALTAFQILKQAYVRGAAEQARGNALYNDLNQAGAQIMFKYLPKEEQSKYLVAMKNAQADDYEMQEAA